MSISIKSLSAKPSKMWLNPPFQTNSALFFEVVGENSTQYKNARRELLMSKPSEYFSSVDMSKPAEFVGRSDELEKDAIRLLAACVIGWSGFEEEYSQELLIDILTQPEFDWLVNQLRDYIADSSNFFQGSKLS